MPGPEQICVDLVSSDRYRTMPDGVVQAVTARVLDTLACAVAGAGTPVATAVRGTAEAFASGGSATVLGSDAVAAPTIAALANATAAHALELDDTDAASFCHIGAVVVPAALAVAETLQSSGRELLEAVAAGYDVAGIVARLTNPEHRLRGFHTTATATTFGAAAAAARLHGVDGPGARSALGVAASFVGGTFAFLADGSNLKRVHAGKAAMSGILATELSIAGVDGPTGAIDGEYGFLRMFSGGSPELDSWDGFVVEEVGVKPYPCCRFCHASVDAAIELRRAHGSALGEATSVRVAVSELCLQQTGDPRPLNELQRQFSTPYGVALGLLRGRAGLPDYRDAPDAEALELATRVEMVVDPALALDDRTSTVTVRTSSGAVHRETVVRPSGEPENPLSAAALRAKFDDLTVPVLGREQAVDLHRQLSEIADAPDLVSLSKLLATH